MNDHQELKELQLCEELSQEWNTWNRIKIESEKTFSATYLCKFSHKIHQIKIEKAYGYMLKTQLLYDKFCQVKKKKKKALFKIVNHLRLYPPQKLYHGRMLNSYNNHVLTLYLDT